MLLLAVHTVQEPSAKVPFCMVALLDAIKKKNIPQELKCRQVFPTSDTKSTSLWDAPSQSALQNWLDEYLEADCNSEVFQVQEEFAYGISAELTRIRATEKVTETTRNAAADAQLRVGELDAKLKVSEHAAAAYKSAKDTSQAAAKRTAEVFGKVGQQAQSQYSKAMENQKIAAAATALNNNISAGWKTLSSGLSSGLGSFVRTASDSQASLSPGGTPKHHSPLPVPASAPPSASFLPVAKQPEKESKSAEEKSQQGDLFTLEDEPDEDEHRAKVSKT